MRVKGRFVKMSPEQRAALKLKQKALRSARAAAGAAGSRGGASGQTDSRWEVQVLECGGVPSMVEVVGSDGGGRGGGAEACGGGSRWCW